MRLSVAAVLLCTTNPQQHFPGAYIQCVHYPESARSEGGQLDAFDATGTLDAQIDASLAWLQRRMSTSARKTPYRVETPQFDTLALFEAIVNAVVHRDYSIRGSRIRLLSLGVHLFRFGWIGAVARQSASSRGDAFGREIFPGEGRKFGLGVFRVLGRYDRRTVA